jgi:hypothetical protein
VPETVDAVIDVPLESCPFCGGPIDDVHAHEQFVVEIPPVKPSVTQFVNHSGTCTRCGRRSRSRHADQTSGATGAAGVQIGPRALALAVDIKHRVGVVYRKVTGLFDMFFGLHVSPGALVRAEKRIAQSCEPTYQRLIEEVRHSPVVHADETGWHIATADKKAWLWVFATPGGETLYAIRTSRGKDVVDDVLGDEYVGTLVVDGWGAYKSLECRKAQCIAHLFRRCAELLEVQKRGSARFPHAVKEILTWAMDLKRVQLEGLWSTRLYRRQVRQLEADFDKLLHGQLTDPDNRRFAKHLRAHQDEVFVFLRDPAVAPTNNLAEREIRPAVLVRKISAGNRTPVGAHVHEVLASLSRTAERKGLLLPELLPDLLRSNEPAALLPIFGPAPTLHPIAETAHGPQCRPNHLPRDGGNVLRRAGRPLSRGHGADARAPPS